MKMEKFKLTKNLWLHEYVDKETYIAYHNANILHKLAYKIDADMLRADQLLRDKFGEVTINNWFYGGDKEWRGLRLPFSKDYSKDSLHSEFKGSDKIFKYATANEVLMYIQKNWRELGITAIEIGVGWVHSDTRFIPNQKHLFIFSK